MFFVESFVAPPLSRCVTAATEVVMIGGGGRNTGAGARRFSIEMDRNTLRGLVEFETVVGDVTRDAGVCMLGARLADVMASCVVAAAAELSTAAAVDVMLAAASSCPLSDVIGFCAFDDAEICVEDGVTVIDFCAVVETSGMEMVAFVA